jgi:hypothetical protein
MPIEIVFRPAALDNLLHEPSGTVGRHLAAVGRRIVAAAKQQVGVDTGRLKNSIHMRHVRAGVGQFIEVGSPVKHALVHHEGSRPHLIVPNRAQVLRFTSGSRVIYTHTVRHPGTRPNRYLTDNLYLIR